MTPVASAGRRWRESSLLAAKRRSQTRWPMPGVRAHRLACGRAPQHGRAGVPQGRHRARHARLQPDRAQREQRDRSRCSRARPGTTSRTCCIRALRCEPCSRPTSSRVGGSISVNAHGMDHQAGALAKSIKSMRVMLADGSLQTVSPTENKELFDLVVGGYGLFGVIVEAELDIADNLRLPDRPARDGLQGIPGAVRRRDRARTSNIGLMYGHLSTAPSTFLKEMLLYTYTKVDGTRLQARAARRGLGRQAAAADRQSVQAGAAVPGNEMVVGKAHRAPDGDLHGDARAGDRIGRGLPRQPQRPDARFGALSAQLAARRHRHPARIFHSAAPAGRRSSTACARSSRSDDANLLNASVRIVHQEDNFLTYSPEPAFSLVLYINQTTDDDGNRADEEADAAS